MGDQLAKTLQEARQQVFWDEPLPEVEQFLRDRHVDEGAIRGFFAEVLPEWKAWQAEQAQHEIARGAGALGVAALMGLVVLDGGSTFDMQLGRALGAMGAMSIIGGIYGLNGLLNGIGRLNTSRATEPPVQ